MARGWLTTLLPAPPSSRIVLLNDPDLPLAAITDTHEANRDLDYRGIGFLLLVPYRYQLKWFQVKNFMTFSCLSLLGEARYREL